MSENSSNEEILKEIMKNVSEQCKIFTFKVTDVDTSMVKTRLPTRAESIQKAISLLREMYNEYDCISRKTYYTMKGHIKKWQILNVLAYLQKIKDKKGIYGNLSNEFISRYNTYTMTQIPYFEAQITLNKPVQCCIIEIEINKEDK